MTYWRHATLPLDVMKVGLPVCLLALAGCTHAPWNPNKGWAASKTEHVTVFTDALTEHRFSQQWLELSHAAYSVFLPAAGLQRQKVEVVWVKSEPGWLTRFFWPSDDPRNAWTLESLPGDGPIGRQGLIVLETRDQNAATTQLAHLFIEAAVPKASLWLHVGLARYMAKARIHRKGESYRACFGSAHFDEPVTAAAAPGPESYIRPRNLDPIRSGTGRNVTIPLDRVLRDDWYGYDRDGRYWYEYTAYGFVHFLIHGHSGWHRTRFPLFLEALARGAPVDEALASAYPHILPDEWDDLVANHVRPSPGRARMAAKRELLQGICLPIPPVHAVDKTPEPVAVDESSIRTLMNDLNRIDLFRRRADWVPGEVVAAEAANRPLRGGRGTGPSGEGSAAAGGQAPGGPLAPRKPPPVDPSIPSIRMAPEDAPAQPPPSPLP
jgi:hypothetical protein